MYLFAGEAFDSSLGLYYSRARYLNTNTGRFWTTDIVAADELAPMTINRYLFAQGNPTGQVDPSGAFPLIDRIVAGQKIHSRIGDEFVNEKPGRFTNRAVSTIIARFLGLEVEVYTRPDLVDTTTKEVYEIKSVATHAAGIFQLQDYVAQLNQADPGGGWRAGESYTPATPIRNVYKNYSADVYPAAGDGVITYRLYEQDDKDDGGNSVDDTSIDLAILSTFFILPIAIKASASVPAQVGLDVSAATGRAAATGVAY